MEMGVACKVASWRSVLGDLSIRINEVALYEWVPLRGANLMVNVRQWSDECMAAGKLSTIWIRAKGVPRSMKNYHGLCQVGSTVGQVVEVDMNQVKAS